MTVEDEERWAEWTVDDVLTRCPSCAMAFVRMRTACAGCTLARFCTLRDVARTYHLSLAELVGALVESGLTPSPPNTAPGLTAAARGGSR